MSNTTRRRFLKTLGATAVTAGALGGCAGTGRKRPNVIIIITDDQGYGDLGCHGNEIVRTPNIDRFASESVEFSRFHVCPVCAPTRASLMTGRYNYRTRVVDTWKGRAMMEPEEFTLAEALRAAGYRTGIFGKWHLGDNIPMRTIDQGFEESVVHLGGGLVQASDKPENAYFDPILMHNGEPERYYGYCMDIYADESIQFMKAHADEPFFVYLATNTPHDPLQVNERYAEHYRSKGVADKNARLYGMVENIDENVGRILTALDELGCADDTFVIFLSDNGPWLGSVNRYNAGLRGAKGTVYDGGIRVPFFVRWPNGFNGGKMVDRIAAHIDIMPTILDACGIEPLGAPRMDGVSLIPLLTGTADDWPDRTLFFQWHRGDKPQMYRCFAARNQRYKLLQTQGGAGSEMIIPEDIFRFELYDMETDPGEEHDISAEKPDIVEALKTEYEAWFREVSAERGYDPPRIQIGSPRENPVTLTRQDWRGSAGWSDTDMGWWEVDVLEQGRYDVTLRISDNIQPEETIAFRLSGASRSTPIYRGQTAYLFEDVELPAGEGRFEAWAMFEGRKIGVKYADIRTAR